MSKKCCLLLSIAVSLVYSILISFGHPVTMYSGADGSIFEQVGLGMLQGKIPYVDLFDHKGFVLYIIQAMALSLTEGNLGIFIFTLLAKSISVYFWIMTTSVYIKGWQAILPTLFALSVANITGLSNTTELWSLPIISYSLYVAVKSYANRAFVTKGECLGIGFGMGMILFLRMNNMASICIVCLSFAIYYIWVEKYKVLWTSIVYALGGFLCSSLLVIVIFVVMYGKENINAMIYGTFIFNFEYVDKFVKGSIMSMPFYLSVFIMVAVILSNKKRNAIETTFIVSCFVLSYLTFGKTYFLHYFTVTLPLYVIALTSIMKSVDYNKIRYNYAYVLAFLLLLIVYAVQSHIIPSNNRLSQFEEECTNTFALVSTIPVTERDSIWNYNGEMICTNILQSIRTVQMNRIFLPMQLGISENLKENGSIETVHPKWIVMKKETCWSDVQKTDSMYMATNYSPIFESYGSPSRVVVFLKRK